MKKRTILALLALALIVGVLSGCVEQSSVALSDGSTEYYYAVEQNGVVCGFGRSIAAPTTVKGKPAIALLDSITAKVGALGKQIEAHYRFEYLIDSASGMYTHHVSHIEQGGTKLGATVDVVGDSIIIVAEPNSDTSIVHYQEGTIFQNTRIFKRLVDYFVDEGLTEKVCPVFSEIDATINNVTYTKLGTEPLDLAGNSYEALKVKSLDQKTGVQTTLWIDTKSGLMLQFENALRRVYLSDAGVRDRIRQVNLDENIFARVNLMISNPWAISSMRVKALMQPGGAWITEESLNVPGQKFEGSVEENRIDGVFEITHPRYFGDGAPPFPCDFSSVESLQVYLKPSDLIESDDPAVVKKAQELTEGSKDAWEAATRLSKWVNKEIGYDLPGGITAAHTLETRVGECGSHSNLLAGFCRAVGIPARCVFGCMYVPEQGGAFGQHAWNEIYMGKAGWIPVDATVDEVSYVDCGHIRLGEWASKAIMLNAKKMEVVDYAVGEGTYADLVKASAMNFDKYVGKYQGPDKILTVSVQDQKLALDIPGKMVFQLKDPDENGDWFFALTAKASVSFERDNLGRAIAMTINSRQFLPRLSSDSSVVADEDTPADLQPYIGKYTIPMAQLVFEILSTKHGLTLGLPGDKKLALEESGNEGEWIGDTGKSKLLISFDRSESGEVTAMRYSELVRCPRLES